MTLEQLPQNLTFLRASNNMMTTDPDPMKAAPTEEISTESNNATMQSNDASASTSAHAPTFTPATASASAPVSASTNASASSSTTATASGSNFVSTYASASTPASASASTYTSVYDSTLKPAGIPLLPNSFEDTEWLIPPRNETARLKARHAYNQWKQATSPSTHDSTTDFAPDTSSACVLDSDPAPAPASALLQLLHPLMLQPLPKLPPLLQLLPQILFHSQLLLLFLLRLLLQLPTLI